MLLSLFVFSKLRKWVIRISIIAAAAQGGLHGFL